MAAALSSSSSLLSSSAAQPASAVVAVNANAGNNTLRFKEVGVLNGVGAYLDKRIAADPSIDPALTTPLRFSLGGSAGGFIAAAKPIVDLMRQRLASPPRALSGWLWLYQDLSDRPLGMLPDAPEHLVRAVRLHAEEQDFSPRRR